MKKYAELYGNIKKHGIKNPCDNKLNVVKLGDAAAKRSFEQLRNNNTFMVGDILSDQIKQYNEGVASMQKQYETVGNIILPLYKVTYR